MGDNSYFITAQVTKIPSGKYYFRAVVSDPSGEKVYGEATTKPVILKCAPQRLDSPCTSSDDDSSSNGSVLGKRRSPSEELLHGGSKIALPSGDYSIQPFESNQLPSFYAGHSPTWLSQTSSPRLATRSFSGIPDPEVPCTPPGGFFS